MHHQRMCMYMHKCTHLLTATHRRLLFDIVCWKQHATKLVSQKVHTLCLRALLSEVATMTKECKNEVSSIYMYAFVQWITDSNSVFHLGKYYIDHSPLQACMWCVIASFSTYHALPAHIHRWLSLLYQWSTCFRAWLNPRGSLQAVFTLEVCVCGPDTMGAALSFRMCKRTLYQTC